MAISRTRRPTSGSRSRIGELKKEHSLPANHLYYLAVAPRFFGEVVKQLGAAGLAEESNGDWRRVVIEKPFGRDLDSARALNIADQANAGRAADLSH